MAEIKVQYLNAYKLKELKGFTVLKSLSWICFFY